MGFKGQIISKANCQAMNSSKNLTNEFIFATMRRVFIRFLEEIVVSKKASKSCIRQGPPVLVKMNSFVRFLEEFMA